MYPVTSKVSYEHRVCARVAKVTQVPSVQAIFDAVHGTGRTSPLSMHVSYRSRCVWTVSTAATYKEVPRTPLQGEVKGGQPSDSNCSLGSLTAKHVHDAGFGTNETIVS